MTISPSVGSTRSPAVKNRTCTNLGTGANYPCTQAQYDQMNAADEPGYQSVTKNDCHNKENGADYASCHAAGYNWGRTEEEMRQDDASSDATCATGSQLYWAEHPCHIVRQNSNSITYNDGSTLKF